MAGVLKIKLTVHFAPVECAFIMNISKSNNLSIANQNDLQSIITLAQFNAASPAFGDEARKKLGKDL